MKLKILDYTNYWKDLYYKESTKKTKIVLHHTAGYDIYSSEFWLRKLSSKSYRESNYYVGVHYFIDRDGTIIQTIPLENWAYHSGTGNSNIDKSSISIELANLGYLNDEYKDLYNNQWNLDKNKGIFSKYKYEFVVLENKWRNYKIYEKYNEKQIEALCNLLDYLFDVYKIEKTIFKKEKFLPEENVYNEVIKSNCSIITHCQLLGKKPNYIKWDLSIVFPYEQFVKNLDLKIC